MSTLEGKNESRLEDDTSNDSSTSDDEVDAKWISFDSTSDSLGEWLTLNKPSQLSRTDGIEWISINQRHLLVSDPIVEDISGLVTAWQGLILSKTAVNYEIIRDLALAHNVTTGKWLFYVPTGQKVDTLWREICIHFFDDKFKDIFYSAKVSSYKHQDPKHVICVYNRNFSNEHEVYALENALRTIGVKCTLLYKPDVYTWCGIYRNNEWKLRPTIYSSNYDVRTRQSNIADTR